MKRLVIIIAMLSLAVGLFAEGTGEISDASAALINELTKTVQEGKSVVNEYMPLGIDGLVKAKRAYFGIMFPMVPLLTLAGLGFCILGFVLMWCDDFDFEAMGALGMFLLVMGIIAILIFGIWSIREVFGLKIFEAARKCT